LTTKQVTTKGGGGALTIGEYLFSETVKNRLELAVPKWMSVDRLLRVTYTAMMQNPKLKQCTADSWFAFLLRCAQLGLEPVLGRCYPIPRQNNKKPGRPMEVHFQPGYQGLLDLANRSKEFSGISAEVVYDCDDFRINLGTHRDIHHVPDYEGRSKGSAKKIGAYAIWVRKDGFVDFEYMPIQEIYSKFRARSDAYGYAVKKGSTDTPWISDEDDMIKKSLLKHSSKYQPASIEIMEAAQLDDMLEMGTPPPIGAALGEPDDDLLPQGDAPEDEPTVEPLDAFYEGIPKDVDITALDEYTLVCMQGGDYESADDFRIAVVNNKQLPEFFNAFRLWHKQQMEPAAPEKKEPATKRAGSPPREPQEKKTSPAQQKAVTTKPEPEPEEEEPPLPPPPPPEETVDMEEGLELEEGESPSEWPDKSEDGDDLILCPTRNRKFMVRICAGCKTKEDCEAFQEYQRIVG
jgi:recombination protein RecT